MLKASFFLNLSVVRRIFIIFRCFVGVFRCFVGVFRRAYFALARFCGVYLLRRHVTITHFFEVFRVDSVYFRLISLCFSELSGLDYQVPQNIKNNQSAENRRVNDEFRCVVMRFGVS